MAAEPPVLDAFRAYLVDLGLVRVPTVAGPLPPMWKNPADGTPAPTQAKDRRAQRVTDDAALVTACRDGGDFPVGQYEGWAYRPVVEVVLRTLRPQDARALERAITLAVTQPGGVPALGWVMGGRRVIESRQWRGYSPVDAADGVYTFLVSYRFELYADGDV